MHRISSWLVAALLACLASLAGAASTQPLILAVHPYLPSAEIMTRFTPLAEHLAHVTGRPVTVRVGRDYEHHIDAIGTGSVDIAYMGPVSYVKLVTRHGNKPLLARQEVGGQPYLRGVIIVRQDSPLLTLADLKGKRFAYGDPDSTMSHVIPQRLLQQAGVPESALAHHAFLGAHKNVALAVLAGDYDAGAVKQEVFKELAPKGLRVLATMPPVADHVFVASAKLPAALTDTLRRALWQLKDTAEGKVIMNAIHEDMTALVPAQDKDYDSLRAIVGNTASGPR
ncbi:MAG: phosphate/phosphite/phosphonate ABC transporter substrate-binding protein [Sulfuricaulis sp.]|uniref:phosphate/phosphite/phosphonate ABC transporter substrate-binding protein n=1 Tax=Sulfuricaulis sp. TaxID=2003553 RepID=UPI003C64230D